MNSNFVHILAHLSARIWHQLVLETNTIDWPNHHVIRINANTSAFLASGQCEFGSADLTAHVFLQQRPQVPNLPAQSCSSH